MNNQLFKLWKKYIDDAITQRNFRLLSDYKKYADRSLLSCSNNARVQTWHDIVDYIYEALNKAEGE